MVTSMSMIMTSRSDAMFLLDNCTWASHHSQDTASGITRAFELALGTLDPTANPTLPVAPSKYLDASAGTASGCPLAHGGVFEMMMHLAAAHS
jgi:hypothetical protein